MLDFDCVQKKLEFLSFTYDKSYRIGEFYLKVKISSKNGFNSLNETKVLYQEEIESRILYIKAPKDFIMFLERSFYHSLPNKINFGLLIQDCLKS